jgi:hypothetical protein
MTEQMKSLVASPKGRTNNQGLDVPIKVEVRASSQEFCRYRRLVDSDWNAKTFNAVLKLLWEVLTIRADEQSESIDWILSLKKLDGRNLTIPLPEKLNNLLVTLAPIFREPYVPPSSREQMTKGSRAVVQAEATIISLLLQIVCEISGETGFLRDLQSLLYLNAVHHLLPRLQARRFDTSYSNLVNALEAHALLIWRDEPSHMFYLRGAMLGQLGRQQERLDCLFSALSSTPISDHSYLTKANAYWCELLELGEKERALRWLVSLSRNLPEPYAAEVAEMIQETALFQPRKK